ncbi:MAG: SDR family oxidoreductase [Planctomycetes bacterium]|nr:SDR family oxidoreductase [Planctomycetota bacterium]
MPSTRLIFGCGYLGARAAALWQETGDKVYAVTRDAGRANDFQRRGWRPIVADILDPLSLANLPIADTVLFAVARGRGSEVSIERLYVKGLGNVLAALPTDVRRIIYISSTGVYAQDDGSWVDENSPTTPLREGGIASLAAEQLLAADARGPHSIALRMAGLYGPGRVPRRDDLLAGRPLTDPGDGWLNLIHIDDAARVIVAAADSAITGVVNVSDGHPVLRRDYQQVMARLLDAPPPKFEPPADSATTNQRSSGSKRVSNRRLVESLSVVLKYPSYREGLAAILAAANH